MAGGYRNSCGECAYRTSWGTESSSNEEIVRHYERAHPDVFPGGVVEYNPKRQSSSTSPLIWVIGIVILLCFLVSQCDG